MVAFTVQLPDDYRIPANLSDLPDSWWTTTLDYVSILYEESNKVDEKKINTTDELVYQVQITALKDQIKELKDLNETKQIELKNAELQFKNKYDQYLQEQITKNNNTYQQLLSEQSVFINKLNSDLVNIQLNHNKEIIDSYNKGQSASYDEYKILLNNEKNKCQLYYTDTIKSLTEQLEQKQSWIKTLQEQYESKYVNIINDLKEQLDNKASTINKLQEQYLDTEKLSIERSRKEHAELLQRIESLNSQLAEAHRNIEYERDLNAKQMNNQELFNINYTKNTQKLNELAETLKPIKEYYQGTNMQKCQSSEFIVYDYLCKTFLHSVVNQTGQTDHAADIKFLYNKLNCIIEVKNKKVLTRDDIQKFLSDLRAAKDSGVNCGIFISLQTDRFPDKPNTPLIIEYDSVIPVVYLYADVLNLTAIKYAIVYLELILSNVHKSDESTQVLCRHLNDFYNNITSMKDFLQDRIRVLRLEISKTESMIRKQDVALANIDIDHAKFCASLVDHKRATETKVESLDEVKLELSYDNILQYAYDCITSGRSILPSDICKRFNIDIETLDKIATFDTIRLLTRKKYLDSIISMHQIKLYKDLPKDKGLKKDQLISNKIITEHEFRKIGKLFNERYPTKLIIDYCESRSRENVASSGNILNNIVKSVLSNVDVLDSNNVNVENSTLEKDIDC